MRAVRYDRFGAAQQLHVVQVPESAPAAGEVAVRVEAASLNPVDWKIREGALRFVPGSPPPPRTTGLDFAGVVVATGAARNGAAPWQVGQRVFGSVSPFSREGACAEQCVVAADRVAALPESLAFEVAACLPVAAGTAVQALADMAQLQAGQRLLIVGAAGGVGHFAVQFARHAAAQITAVCGPHNVAFLGSLGAQEVIDYRARDTLALGQRFDIVFDVAGVLSWRQAQRLLVRGGLYLGTGGTTAAAVSTAVGSWVAPWLGGTQARNVMLKAGTAAWQRLAELAGRGVLVPHIAERIGLEGVAQAQAAMQRGHGRGKIVVLPRGPSAAA
jgi:NADPH:quinone reductase-like Zn-dependent oxidoreductase